MVYGAREIASTTWPIINALELINNTYTVRSVDLEGSHKSHAQLQGRQTHAVTQRRITLVEPTCLSI